MKNYYRLPPWSGTARFGFGVVRNPIEEYDVSPLGADWYVDFGFRDDPPPLFDMEYAQMVRRDAMPSCITNCTASSREPIQPPKWPLAG
jgi:hypothetical protein